MRQVGLEFGRFAVVGLVSTASNFCIYVALHAAGLGLILATIAGYASGLIVSFECGRRWVYRVEQSLSSLTFIKFSVVYFFSGFGMALVIEGLVRFLHLDYRVAWLCGASLAVLCNFAATRQFVFNKN
jgi:putative flippase GtrA